MISVSSIFLSLFFKNEDDEALQWQKALYKKIGSKKGDQNQQNTLDYSIERVMAMSKVLFGLHLVGVHLHAA